MHSQKVSFLNAQGETLSGQLNIPLGEKPIAYAIFAHCFTCNKNLKAVKNISLGLTQNGVAVLLFDFTGLGRSEGDFADTTFGSNISDLMAASEYLEANYQAPKIMIGHSLGGAAALFAAKQLTSIEALVTIGSPFEPQHVVHLFSENLEEIKAKGKAEVNIGGRPFWLGQQFVDEIHEHNAAEVAANLRKPILIMHSPQDTIVGISNAAELYTHARHPKSFISLDGADHLLSQEKDSKYAGSMIAHWVRKYIQVEGNQLVSEAEVAVSTPTGTFTSEVKAGRHRFLADEPTSVGGQDLGPNPYQYLSTALASCTTLTLQMYAKRKEWPLQEVIVHIDHEKRHADDMADMEEPKSKIDHFEKRIELIGNLDETQRQKLLEIADKCPVHRTLHSEVIINTELI